MFLNFILFVYFLLEMGIFYYLFYLLSVNIILGMKSRILLVRIKFLEEREIIILWEVDCILYMYLFVVIKNYVVFFVCLYFINVKKMVRYVILEWLFDWEKESLIILYVVYIKLGKVVIMMIDNVFMMY